MSFTIYTVSDPATVGAALTSMAMFFGQDSWVGSALKTALLVSLLFILAKGVMREGLRLDTMLLQLLVVMVAFLPKTTVTIEQFDNAAPPRVVDGVPYAIAIPGSIAGAFALYMTQKIETVMTGVDGNYISVSGGMGPFTPARILLSYTACASDPMSCMDRNLAETLRLAARYCGGPKLSNANFGTVRSVFNEFSSGLYDDGMTIIYTNNKPYMNGGGGGEAADCAQAKDYISSLSDTLSSGDASVFKTKMEGLAQGVNVKRYKAIDQADDGTLEDWSDTLGKINRVTDDLGKVDTLALANVMSFSVLESLRLNADAPIGQSISIKRDVGLFEWAKSEAAQSMLVSSTAPKFMDVLFFVFIAATPIVMFVVAANPASGMKVAGSYILFGIWTQSWIPMLAIITGWYQGEIQNFPRPGAEGATVEYMANMMRHVNTSTIAAANMIQSAPYIMFAIMSGSMMAMSNMIAKAAPSGGAGSGDLTGSSGGGGGGAKAGILGVPGAPGPDVSPAAAQRAAIAGGLGALRGGLGGESTFTGGSTAANLPGMADMNLGAAVQASTSANNEKSAALRSGLQAQHAQTMADFSSFVKGAGHGVDGKKLAQAMTNAGYASTFNASTGEMTTGGTSINLKTGQVNSSGFSTEMGGAIKGAASLGWRSSDNVIGMAAKLLGAPQVQGSVGVEAGASAKRTGSSASTVDLNRTQSTGNQTHKGNNTQLSATNGSTAGTGTSGSDGFTASERAEKGQRIADSFDKIASQAKQLDEADKLTRSAQDGASAAVGTNIKGGVVADNWSASQKAAPGGGSSSFGAAMARVGAAISGALPADALSNIQAQAAQIHQQNLASGAGNTLSMDQRAAAATWQALAGAANNGATAQERAAAYAGMLAMANSAGVAVGGGSLKVLEQSRAQFQAAETNIAAMAKEVKPAADAAAAAVAGKLAEKPQAVAAIDAKIQANEEGARALYGGAVAQAGQTFATGIGKVQNEIANAKPAMVDAEQIAENARKDTDNKPFLPTDSDQSRVLTPPGKESTPGVVGGAVATGEAAAAGLTTPASQNGLMREMGAILERAGNGGLTGAVGVLSPLALTGGAPSGSPANAPASAGGSPAASALPTTGGGGGISLTPSGNGGGGTPITPGTSPGQNAKPSASGVPGKGDGKGKKGMPSR